MPKSIRFFIPLFFKDLRKASLLTLNCALLGLVALAFATTLPATEFRQQVIQFDAGFEKSTAELAAEFFEKVIVKDDKVRAQLEKKEAHVRGEADGKFQRRLPDVIEWFSSAQIEPNPDQPGHFKRELTILYVLRSPLLEGHRGGFVQRTNILALVEACVQDEGIYEPETVTSATITLRFLGFVDELPARKPESGVP